MPEPAATIDQGEVAELDERLQAASRADGERPRADALAQELRATGLEATVQAVDAEHRNVVAAVGGGDGPHLLLAAPLDAATDPERGCLSAVCLAAVAARRTGLPSRGRLTLALVGGTAQGGIGVAHLLGSSAAPDCAVFGVPTDGVVYTAQTGMVTLLITTLGKSAWVGAQHIRPHVNAVYLMRDALSALRELSWDHVTPIDFPSIETPVTFGPLLGGFTREYYLRRPSQHADVCSAIVNVHFPPGLERDAVVARVQAILEGVKEGTPSLAFTIETPPATARAPWRAQQQAVPALNTPADYPFVKLACRLLEGTRPSVAASTAFQGPVGAGHLQAAGIPCVLFGPSATTHGVDVATTAGRLAALVAEVDALTVPELVESDA
jgi:acetylornithine deacetylase/succinyl-diaminopimelate desuccinylase-like protein